MRAHQLLEPMHTQTPTHGFLHAVAAHGRHRLPLVRGREQRLAVLQDVAAHAELVQAKLAEQAAERVALLLHLRRRSVVCVASVFCVCYVCCVFCVSPAAPKSAGAVTISH